jgi:hypothetical protein
MFARIFQFAKGFRRPVNGVRVKIIKGSEAKRPLRQVERDPHLRYGVIEVVAIHAQGTAAGKGRVQLPVPAAAEIADDEYLEGCIRPRDFVGGALPGHHVEVDGTS